VIVDTEDGTTDFLCLVCALAYWTRVAEIVASPQG
jgi:hypothetical protein